jgi:LPS-assembly protein
MRLHQAVLLMTLIGAAAPAAGQAPVTETTIANRHDVISENEHHYIGSVEIEIGDTKLYADDVWYYVETNRAIATGNVVFRQGGNQISADRADFDTRTRLGTFTNATGFAAVQPPRQRGTPGAVAPPPVPGQETIVYFFGETVQKIGPQKYRITKGGFTTCVQPTPRWDFHADTIVLNVDHYTLLKNVVMSVKGVPMFYLPALYYPTKREDRATGFLIPTYGASTLRGQQIHNAFFWAINRSQDATFMHDWYSKTGNGVGTEYRYNYGGGDDGSIRAHLLDQTESTYVATDGTIQKLDASRSYDIVGSMSQTLTPRLRSRARVDYFSSIATNQTYNVNLNDASRSRRSYGGNVIGTWRTYSLNGTFDYNEQFYNRTSSAVSGRAPGVTVTRNERPLPGLPVYFAATADYSQQLSKSRVLATEVDRGLGRFDVRPQVRIPYTRLQWLTVNTVVNWRDTIYSRSYDLDPLTGQPLADAGNQPIIVDEALNRSYFTIDSQMSGPVFNRIFDTPGNGYAEKFKHSIEPFFNVRRVTAIDNYNQIIKLADDWDVGGNTQYTYGLVNRLYAKRRSPIAGQPSQPRTILTVDLRQTYYTVARAAQVDAQYGSSNGGVPTSNFSPVALTVSAQPTNEFSANARAEFDSRYRALRTVNVSATYAWSSRLQSNVIWSKKGFIPELAGFNDPNALDQAVGSTSTVRTRDNKYGTIYSFNYDVLRGYMIQQRISGFYNAQCCGVAAEYQTFHFGNSNISTIPSDHRFFMSFTLAGLGNFSPFNGALSGVPR